MRKPLLEIQSLSKAYGAARALVDVSLSVHAGEIHARDRRIDDIMAFDDQQLEYVHDYIQWLFPLPETSAFNPFAPVLTRRGH